MLAWYIGRLWGHDGLLLFLFDCCHGCEGCQWVWQGWVDGETSVTVWILECSFSWSLYSDCCHSSGHYYNHQKCYLVNDPFYIQISTIFRLPWISVASHGEVEVDGEWSNGQMISMFVFWRNWNWVDPGTILQVMVVWWEVCGCLPSCLYLRWVELGRSSTIECTKDVIQMVFKIFLVEIIFHTNDHSCCCSHGMSMMSESTDPRKGILNKWSQVITASTNCWEKGP